MALFAVQKPSKPVQAAASKKHQFIQPGQFTAEEQPIAEKIQQRRLQMLVNSRIYYVLDQNIISDYDFDRFGNELVKLQAEYPHIAERVCFAEAFADWDASTGAFLPLNDEWVVQKAEQLLRIHAKERKEVEHTKIQQSTGKPSGKEDKRKPDSKQRRNSLF